jgi:hypothetical protein
MSDESLHFGPSRWHTAAPSGPVAPYHYTTTVDWCHRRLEEIEVPILLLHEQGKPRDGSFYNHHCRMAVGCLNLVVHLKSRTWTCCCDVWGAHVVMHMSRQRIYDTMICLVLLFLISYDVNILLFICLHMKNAWLQFLCRTNYLKWLDVLMFPFFIINSRP